MKSGAVIGSPISHSLSPRLFEIISRVEGVPFSFEAIEVQPGNLKDFMEDAKKKFIGLSVTIPHKEKIIGLLDGLSNEAKALGAVNCVEFLEEKNKILSVGHNTDVDGFKEALRESELSIKGMNVALLGAGGAARAVAYAIGALGCSEVYIFNRSEERSLKLVDDLSSTSKNTKYIPANLKTEIKDVCLIVNATPLGMTSFDTKEVDLLYFKKVFEKISKAKGTKKTNDTVVFDLIYKPLYTPFMKMGFENGFVEKNGLKMLIFQAIRAWEIWVGPLQNKEKVLRKLRRDLVKPERIFLTGFMGSGKSTVAKTLAKNLGWTLIDTDKLIEERTKLSAGETFLKKGESFFRKLEDEILRDVLQKNKTVIALGGGGLNQAK